MLNADEILPSMLYKKSLFVGDLIEIQVTVEHVGTTSFTFAYTLKRGTVLVGTAKTVHVTVSAKTKKKMTLPPKMRKALTAYL